MNLQQIQVDLFPSGALSSMGQIRLAELSVFNWGSFNGLHTARVDPMGTLITGDNGSGKSTFIDGLMALLLPAGKAAFNVAAAQGDRADRSLLSYMRGTFGSAHDGVGTRVRSKRESAVVTGLRALYAGEDGVRITLAGLFWTTQSTNALADVKRIYSIARRDLSLKEMLDAFGEGNARYLKQWLRDDPAITCCDDRFAEYQELYRKLLYMDNKNAPALLSRALGLKKIDDLTRLIRELVLEPSTVREDAAKVVHEFSDLVAIHGQLVDARAQKDHLARLPELGAAMEKASLLFERSARERDGLPAYFGLILARLWQERIGEIEAQLASIAREISQTETRESDAAGLVERRHEEYLQLGGDKIENLARDIDRARAELEAAVRESSRYQEETGELGFPTVLEEAVFVENQRLAQQGLENIRADNESAQDRLIEAASKLSELQKQKAATEEEIRAIEARPDSNIDPAFQRMRDEMTGALGLDREKCLFIGELLDVKEEETHWRGAIERALGGLRTTLAVPRDTYPMVTRWLNARHTGLHARVQVVRELESGAPPPVFKADGYLRKLLWREHPYREWLKNHLQRFDLRCVANTEELDRTPFSMTEQGLTHLEKGRFEKKDRYRIGDKRQWCLGFSNQSRLAMLDRDKKDIARELSEVEKQVGLAREGLDAIAGRKGLLEKIQDHRWERIDAPYRRERLSALEADREELARSGGDLDKAKSRWESAKEELSRIQTALNERFATQGGIRKELESAEEEREKAEAEAEPGLAEDIRAGIARRAGPLNREHLQQVPQIRRGVQKQLEDENNRARTKKEESVRAAERIMASFRSRDRWQPLTVDWSTDIRALPDYMAHLRQLEDEGLPNLVEQFVERLNRHATQSLARVKTRLESEREEIMERIDIINLVLERTEFRPGSHLKLGTKKEKYPHVHEFQQHLNKVLGQVTSDDHEGRFHQLAKVVEILEKASSPGTAGTLESMRLLDPRYQMSFYAEELGTQTGEVRDVLESSSGKSGGEKESFAGTIVAASLAYVLTPDGHDRPVYCTVFLDEAFSNTAEAVSRRVLRVFKELHIHVNLITPYKNLNLARESARSLLIAERDPENHDSRLCEVTWEEIDQKMDQEKQRTLSAEARELGVEVEVGVGVEVGG